MGEACEVFETPITGGNVSFYNENRGEAVWPSPVIGMIGLIEEKQHITTSGFKKAGDVVLLAGGPAQHLGGSQLFAALQDRWVGPCPDLDMAFERRLQEFVLGAIRVGLVESAQDLAEGGLGIALCECCLNSPAGLGANVALPAESRSDVELLSEAPSRIILTVSPGNLDSLEAIAEKCNVPVRKLGKVAPGGTLRIEGLDPIGMDEMRTAYRASERAIQQPGLE